jgi:hypothetical protein
LTLFGSDTFDGKIAFVLPHEQCAIWVHAKPKHISPEQNRFSASKPNTANASASARERLGNRWTLNPHHEKSKNSLFQRQFFWALCRDTLNR